VKKTPENMVRVIQIRVIYCWNTTLGSGLDVGWQLISCEQSGNVLVLRVVRRKAE
jgi:hypothetical protein